MSHFYRVFAFACLLLQVAATCGQAQQANQPTTAKVPSAVTAEQLQKAQDALAAATKALQDLTNQVGSDAAKAANNAAQAASNAKDASEQANAALAAAQ